MILYSGDVVIGAVVGGGEVVSLSVEIGEFLVEFRSGEGGGQAIG